MTEIIDLTNLPSSSEAGDDSQTDHSGSSAQEDEDTSYSDDDDVDEALLSDPNVRAKLCTAILAVPEDRLRTIVLDLVKRVPEAERALFKELLAVHHTELVQRWETCDKCDEEFDANEERATGECQFHPGDLELDEASFVDWDEDCHGPMDTPQNRREYPENFVWSCCEGVGNSLGCVTSVHAVGAPSRKRRRV